LPYKALGAAPHGQVALTSWFSARSHATPQFVPVQNQIGDHFWNIKSTIWMIPNSGLLKTLNMKILQAINWCLKVFSNVEK
jgi:hypothetical protein